MQHIFLRDPDGSDGWKLSLLIWWWGNSLEFLAPANYTFLPPKWEGSLLSGVLFACRYLKAVVKLLLSLFSTDLIAKNLFRISLLVHFPVIFFSELFSVPIFNFPYLFQQTINAHGFPVNLTNVKKLSISEYFLLFTLTKITLVIK